MAEGDPEILPPSGGAPIVPSVTINQFIQLVNKTSALPDAESLNSYSPEDREWIKRRVEIEQDNRHQLLAGLVRNDHEATLANNDNANRNERHRQAGAIGILLGAVAVTGLLLYLGVGYIALGILAILMAAPLAAGIWNQVLNKIQVAAKKDDPN
ncbi:MAG: hypothetical protein LV480_04665 [Methylacidiphilales bacterium]|nr:hypothetical protein [Candidatus Methylacidiphilales bacterium]